MTTYQTGDTHKTEAKKKKSAEQVWRQWSSLKSSVIFQLKAIISREILSKDNAKSFSKSQEQNPPQTCYLIIFHATIR